MTVKKTSQSGAGAEQKIWQNTPDSDFRLPVSDSAVFKKTVEVFPFPVHLHTPDGVTVYINAAGCAAYGVSGSELIGRYNFLEDADVGRSVSMDELRRVLKGETVFFPAVRFPFTVEENLYSDVTLFPLTEKGRVDYFAVLEVPCDIRKKKYGIERAKEYLYNNWNREFDRDGAIKASGFSRAHFTRLFKEQTGFSPIEFYTDIKIAKLKEKLKDAGLSEEEACAESNLPYNPYTKRIFKKLTGFSFSGFRKQSQKTK